MPTDQMDSLALNNPRKDTSLDPNRAANSLTTMTKSTRDYESMIFAAREFCKRQFDRWDKNISLYKGVLMDFRKQRLKAWTHMIESNLTRPVIDTMLPNIIFQQPKINIRPAREIADQQSSITAMDIENEMNAILLELDQASEYKAATKDALILGFGCIKFGLTTDFDFDKDNYTFPAPFIKRVSPWEVWIDPATRDYHCLDSSYIVFRNIVPIERVRSDSTLLRPERLQSTFILDTLPQHVKDTRDTKNTGLQYGVLYELWDRETQKLIVTDDAKNIYREDDWPYDLNGQFPATFINFNRVPEEFYSMGEPEFLYYLQLEMSEKRTQQLNHTRRYNRKYQVPLDAPDDDITSLREGDDGTIIRSNHPVSPIVDAPLSIDLYNEMSAIKEESKEVTGISAYQRGGSESGVYSATAAQLISSSANIRIEERRMEVAKSMSQGARILYNILKPIKQWPDMSFNFTIDVSTMQRPDDEGKRSQLIQFGQLANNFPEFKRVNFLRDLALAFHKPPDHYCLTDQELAQQQQNKPPDPNVQKAQVEQALAQIEIQKKQTEAQISVQTSQAKLQIDMQKLELEKVKLELERRKVMQNAALQLQMPEPGMSGSK